MVLTPGVEPRATLVGGKCSQHCATLATPPPILTEKNLKLLAKWLQPLVVTLLLFFCFSQFGVKIGLT